MWSLAVYMWNLTINEKYIYDQLIAFIYTYKTEHVFACLSNIKPMNSHFKPIHLDDRKFSDLSSEAWTRILDPKHLQNNEFFAKNNVFHFVQWYPLCKVCWCSVEKACDCWTSHIWSFCNFTIKPRWLLYNKRTLATLMFMEVMGRGFGWWRWPYILKFSIVGTFSY